MTQWDEVRAEFPALRTCAYLNTATYGQTPRKAVDAIVAHLRRRDELACADFLSWYDDADAIRDLCAKLVHCEAGDIAFIHNAALGLATLLNGLDWREGDEVLALEHEFPNQAYQGPLLQRYGVTFRAVAPEDLLAACGERTRVVLASALNYGTGYRVPLEDWGPELRRRGILFYVDATQGLGALQNDMAAIRPAVFAVDCYKWMLTPNGGGFMYVDPEVRPAIAPTVVGWRSDRNWRQVNNLNHGDPVYSDEAERYEGGKIVFPSLYAMGEVVRMMLQIGPTAIEARVLSLADQTREILSAKGADVNRDRSPIVTAKFADREAGALAMELKSKGVMASARHGRLRVSTHFYNNEADLAALDAAIA